MSLLEVGGSQRYLRSPCVGAWTPTPPRSPGANTRSFPEDFGLTLRVTRLAREKLSLPCNFHRAEFLGAAVIP